MLKIGVTGNIGSGKSQICRIFELLGIPVYYADERAKSLMTSDAELVKAIKALIGEAAYFSDGSLNRQLISQLVFNDKKLLENLNNLVHPAVGRDFYSWSEVQHSAYVVKEAALLFESGSYRELDAVIMVLAPEQLRIKRVIARDGVTEEQVLMRLRNQMEESIKKSMADHTVTNDGESSALMQVLALHKIFLAQGK